MRVRVWCKEHDCDVRGEASWIYMCDGTYSFDTNGLTCSWEGRYTAACTGSMYDHTVPGEDKIAGSWFVQVLLPLTGPLSPLLDPAGYGIVHVPCSGGDPYKESYVAHEFRLDV